jgi:hypothetical protein
LGQAGGGNGANFSGPTGGKGDAGSANSGSGGGGCTYPNSDDGSTGGSGIVIIRYKFQ